VPRGTLMVYPPLSAVVVSYRDPLVVSMTVTLRPGTATAESAVVTTPAIVPPVGGCFAPAFTTGPGWQAATSSADASNIHVKRIPNHLARCGARRGPGKRRGSGFGVRGSGFVSASDAIRP